MLLHAALNGRIRFRAVGPGDSAVYFSMYRSCLRNAEYFGFGDEASMAKHLDKKRTSDVGGAWLILDGDQPLGLVEFGFVEEWIGITRFGLLNSTDAVLAEVVMSISRSGMEGHQSIRAIFEEQYEHGFRAAGFRLLGRRINRALDLDAMSIEVEGGQASPSSLSAASAETVAACLLSAYSGGVDVAIGLYTPTTMDAFLAYATDVLDGGEGTLVQDGSFVIMREEKVAGLVIVADGLCLPDLQKRAVVVEFAVDPDHQAKGFGRSLLRRSCAALKALGYAEIVLQYTQGNAKAERLYADLGFQEMGQRVLRSELVPIR